MNLKEHSIKKRLLAVVLIGLGIFSLAAGGSLVVLDLYSRQALHVEDGHLVKITQGMSVTQLSGLLAERQIIPSVRSFIVYVRVANWIDGATIKAGEYQLNANDTVADVVRRFQAGVVKHYRVTFPEGWTVSQWRGHIRSLRDLIIVDEADDQTLLQTIVPATDHLPEGMFYPDTYYFRRGDTEISVLRRAHHRMQSVLAEEWALRGEVPLNSAYEALILASVVEKETGLADDRSLVASVFVNRLSVGQRLESDPTVIYGITDFDGDLTRLHLRTDTPYNTYRRHGLPPTPICNPGRAAISAVLNPAVSDYFYFVARGDGSSQFSRTLEEHEAAVRRYQLGIP